MKRLKRIAVSAVMAGTAAGIIVPVTAAGTMVNVMAQDIEYKVTITEGEGGRVESNVVDVTVDDESHKVFGTLPGGQKLVLKAIPDEGYTFSSWDFEGTLNNVDDAVRFSPDVTVDTEYANGALIEAKAIFIKKQAGAHLIQNATRYSTVPENAKVGEKVHIEVRADKLAEESDRFNEQGLTYLGYDEHYSIERISDGADVTDELMVSTKDFIMPDYDIKVVTTSVIKGIIKSDKIDVVADEIQWETEVFSIEGDPGVLNGITEAHEGETVRLQAPEGINSYIFEIFRKDNGEDITEQIDWIDKDSFYMPECDIRVVESVYSGVLIDDVSTAGEDNSLTEGKIFNIVNESGADVVSVSPPGEEVFLRTPLPAEHKELIEEGYQNVSYKEDYSIIRIEDGVDVTDELLNPATNSFIMPEYDVKIITKTSSSSIALPENKDNVKSQITDADGTVVDEQDWIEKENSTEGQDQDKVLSQITDADGTVVDEENVVDEKKEEEKTGIGMAADDTQNKSVTAVGPTVKTVQSSGAAAATEAVASRIASSAPVTVAAAGTSAVTPVTTRRSGTNPTIVNTAPATGDATGSTAWIIAVAGAAVAVGAAAVTMVQKRKNEG